MAGLVVAISFVLFVGGFLLGALLVVSVGIRAEDKAAMRRRDGSVLLHEEPVSHLSRSVSRCNDRWEISWSARSGVSSGPATAAPPPIRTAGRPACWLASAAHGWLGRLREVVDLRRCAAQHRSVKRI